ncbi:winged helix-turn-helix domain-containing protein [Candidatus Neomarinimicrobiota bacterium]
MSIVDLDPVIHSRLRLAVMTTLAGLESADFTDLKKITEATDGNLSTHLSRLEAAGYIKVKKGYRGKRPLTTCRMTPAGRTAFERYLDQLKQNLFL